MALGVLEEVEAFRQALVQHDVMRVGGWVAGGGGGVVAGWWGGGSAGRVVRAAELLLGFNGWWRAPAAAPKPWLPRQPPEAPCPSRCRPAGAALMPPPGWRRRAGPGRRRLPRRQRGPAGQAAAGPHRPPRLRAALPQPGHLDGGPAQPKWVGGIAAAQLHSVYFLYCLGGSCRNQAAAACASGLRPASCCMRLGTERRRRRPAPRVRCRRRRLPAVPLPPHVCLLAPALHPSARRRCLLPARGALGGTGTWGAPGLCGSKLSRFGRVG